MVSSGWRKDWKTWKKKFPLHKRLLYFLVGYPPKPFELPEESWKRWRARFDAPEYDWTKHSGTGAEGKIK